MLGAGQGAGAGNLEAVARYNLRHKPKAQIYNDMHHTYFQSNPETGMLSL